MNKILSFIWYFITDPFILVYKESKEILELATKKKTWVFMWAVLTPVAFFSHSKLWLLFAILFFLFIIVYQWQKYNEEYIHKEREKLGYNLRKKKE